MERTINMSFDMKDENEMDLFYSIQKKLIQHNFESSISHYEMRITTEEYYLKFQAVEVFYEYSWLNTARVKIVDTNRESFRADLGNGYYDYYDNECDAIKAEQAAQTFKGLAEDDDVILDVYNRIGGDVCDEEKE